MTTTRACTNYQHEGYPREDDEPCTECDGTGYVSANGSLLDDVEHELLASGRALAETTAKLHAALLIAQGFEVQKSEHSDWYSTEEHYTPLVEAKERLVALRRELLATVRTIQGTVPV